MTWIKAIEKDMDSEGSYDQLLIKINDGISYEPAYHPDDRVLKYGPIPWKSDNAWQAIASLDHIPTSNQIDHILQMDLPAISIAEADQIPELPQDDETWKSDLQLHLGFSSIDHAMLVQDHANISSLCVPGLEHMQRSSILQWNAARKNSASVVVITVKIQPTFAQDLLLILQGLIKWLDAAERSQLAPGITIKIYMSEAFLANIAKIRALKLLIMHVWNLYDLTSVGLPNLIAVAHESKGLNADRGLISLMVQSSSAVIAGIDGLIIIPPPSTNRNTTWARRVMSIHHLLKMEGNLDHVVDPLAGSYFIEHFTGSIVQYVWSQFRQWTLR
ncbi:MAG: hypothetical protein HKN87_17820 [Saprospiraceae bacterium]|nr:hypothetical protein [Saprospiraceae bacterium]